jgi:hypothetical protein
MDSRQKHFANWIIKKLKKADDFTMSRKRLWDFYKTDDSYVESDTSAGFSVALKTLLSNGKVEVLFIGKTKAIKLK